MANMRKAWLEEYLQCFNATEAARRVGYKWPNKIGPKIKQEYEKEIKDRLNEMTMTTDEALMRLSQIARADIGRYVTSEGLDIEALKKNGMGHLIKSAKRVVTQFDDRLEIDMHDKQSAIDKILRAHGAYGARGTEQDPIHYKPITYITENRNDTDD